MDWWQEYRYIVQVVFERVRRRRKNKWTREENENERGKGTGGDVARGRTGMMFGHCLVQPEIEQNGLTPLPRCWGKVDWKGEESQVFKLDTLTYNSCNIEINKETL